MKPFFQYKCSQNITEFTYNYSINYIKIETNVASIIGSIKTNIKIHIRNLITFQAIINVVHDIIEWILSY